MKEDDAGIRVFSELASDQFKDSDLAGLRAKRLAAGELRLDASRTVEPDVACGDDIDTTGTSLPPPSCTVGGDEQGVTVEPIEKNVIE